MDRLPQRNDLIYKEIEEFQDYELTNCIAYEMAIRSQDCTYSIEVINADIISGIDLNNTNISDSDKNYLLDFIELSDYIKIFSKNKSDGLNLEEFLQTNEQIKSIMKETMSFEDRLIKYGKIEHLKTLTKESKKEILNKIINLPKLNIKFSRPKVKIKESSLFSIDLNLNLPKEELIAYISKIKDDFDKDNSIIKTPLELLGETLENESIDIKNLPKRDIKRIYADMFYIYDYFTFQDKKYKNEREKLKNKLKTKIKEINKTWDYDKSDKKEKIEQFSDNYKIEKQKYSKEQIIYELMEKLTFNKTKVNDYLKIMRMFIDDLEYKKLLIGGLKLC